MGKIVKKVIKKSCKNCGKNSGIIFGLNCEKTWEKNSEYFVKKL